MRTLWRNLWNHLLVTILLWSIPAQAETPILHELTVPLETVMGDPVRVSDFQGKVVVINFWATWCAPCLQEIPSFIRFQEAFKDRVVVIGVNFMDRRDRKELADFIRQLGINYPIVYGDATKIQSLSRALGGVRGLPDSKLLDREGRLVGSHTGTLDEQRLHDWVMPLLSTQDNQ